jgi:hypothetical protein
VARHLEEVEEEEEALFKVNAVDRTPSATALRWCRRRVPPSYVPVGDPGGATREEVLVTSTYFSLNELKPEFLEVPHPAAARALSACRVRLASRHLPFHFPHWRGGGRARESCSWNMEVKLRNRIFMIQSFGISILASIGSIPCSKKHTLAKWQDFLEAVCLPLTLGDGLVRRCLRMKRNIGFNIRSARHRTSAHCKSITSLRPGTPAMDIVS